MPTITVTNFWPKIANPGMTVAFTVPQGVITAAPHSLHPLHSTFTSATTGKITSGLPIEISDPDTYTTFGVKIPEQIEEGDYYIGAGLYNAQVTYDIKFGAVCTIRTSAVPHIIQITPNMINSGDFGYHTYGITGNNLSQINTSRYIFLQPDNIRMQALSHDDNKITVTPLDRSQRPEPGMYLVRAYTQDGDLVESSARLQVLTGCD